MAVLILDTGRGKYIPGVTEGNIASGAVTSDKISIPCRGTIIPPYASDSAFQTALGRSFASGDRYYNTTRGVVRVYSTCGGYYEESMRDETSTNEQNNFPILQYQNSDLLSLTSERYNGKSYIWVKNEPVRVAFESYKTLTFSSTYAINYLGLSTSTYPAANTVYHVYLSNSSASYAPNSIRLSTQWVAASNYNYLYAYGNGTNWRYVGSVYTNSSSRLSGVQSIAGYGFSIARTTLTSNYTKTSGTLGWYAITGLQQNDICILPGTTLIVFARCCYACANTSGSTENLHTRITMNSTDKAGQSLFKGASTSALIGFSLKYSEYFKPTYPTGYPTGISIEHWFNNDGTETVYANYPGYGSIQFPNNTLSEIVTVKINDRDYNGYL